MSGRIKEKKRKILSWPRILGKLKNRRLRTCTFTLIHTFALAFMHGIHALVSVPAHAHAYADALAFVVLPWPHILAKLDADVRVHASSRSFTRSCLRSYMACTFTFAFPLTLALTLTFSLSFSLLLSFSLFLPLPLSLCFSFFFFSQRRGDRPLARRREDPRRCFFMQGEPWTANPW